MGESQDYKIAELCGAIMGDGWIQKNESGFFIAGDPKEDKEYYDKHLSQLISKILEKEIIPKEFPYWGVYGISVYGKEYIQKLLSFGLAKGKKTKSAYVPDWILKSKDKYIKLAFIRGLFDTDGSIFCQKDYTKYADDFNSNYHTKARIRISLISSRLINQTYNICKECEFRCVKRVKKRGFSYHRNCSDVHILEINEIASINRWFKELNSSNQKHITKYQIWKKFGFCPPNTTLAQRKDILKNRLNPYKLYKQG